ncbi:phosphoinositide phosphatase SAC2-like isoform X2 [Punica granatum]|uniref:Phosphoinositide phosphatase SAC2-like isoform X2 n=1 Tax=Punica granatum TaxID=22663 RepID=A0A6P8DAH9_PUNGR|nr:phosphoinositide phosphatase SAC2-like isoform X2 [Punica granatum]
MAGAAEDKEEGSLSLAAGADSKSYFLQKFYLLETLSNFYIIGRDKTRSYWRVLKISRLEPSELNIVEDPTTYTERECAELLKRLREGNKANGGLKLVKRCYGIIGFIKFLGPYYMLLITEREEIGTICGHSVYTVTETDTIPIPNSSVLSNMALSKDEKRYKKLLRIVDLRKDFFFSYSYNIMFSLQKNLCDNETGQILHETMFVWNGYLTRQIRNNLRSTLWTVALVYGFFKQVTLSVLGKHFKFTLIARRSQHYAGTRYLTRGVNENGKVANDVETEQIVTEDVFGGRPIQISSVVQNRGSIPLVWSHESSRLNLRPEIILSKKDPKYGATRLHFENLFSRYGNPIVILDLVKTHEKKPRESVLSAEFLRAARVLREDLSEENGLVFYHLDLNKYFSSSGATNALSLLCKSARKALDLTGLFYHHVVADLQPKESLTSQQKPEIDSDSSSVQEISSKVGDKNSSQNKGSNCTGDASENPRIKQRMLQNGVLRTNCIDCIDRTNVAQFAYGLVALGRQLQALGLSDDIEIDFDNPLAKDLMDLYEAMGDTLALQYGGSAAHNKIFCEIRGQWKPATQSQELFRTVQRYINNTYTDPEKQDAINLFLGHYRPQLGKPAIWEHAHNSNQHQNAGGQRVSYDEYRNASLFFRRSYSDGNILAGSDVNQVFENMFQKPSVEIVRGRTPLSESSPQISTGELLSHCRDTPSIASSQLLQASRDDHESDPGCNNERGDDCDCSDFINLDWLSSTESIFEEDAHQRGSIFRRKASAASESTVKGEEKWIISIPGVSKKFINWVADGGALFE